MQASPLFRDRRKFCDIADPLLGGRYPRRGLYHALAVAAMCVHEDPSMRPRMADVVTALAYIASQPFNPSDACSSVIQASSPPRRDNRVTDSDIEFI